MLFKEFILTLALVLLVACGNSGDLYLSDEARLRYETDQAEITRLKARIEHYWELQTKTRQLESEIKNLRAQGLQAEVNAKYLTYKELRYEIGRINIERQQESKYGNI